MGVREKLVELIHDCRAMDGYGQDLVERQADHLIANGVTVQDGKPLDAFLHPVDAYKGLKAKYLVFKADTGERVGNCFVLRPDKDPAAVEAIRAYARATDNETLAEDIYNWVGKGEPVQEWISVDDELPEESGYYLVFTDIGRSVVLPYSKKYQAFNAFDDSYSERNVIPVTHWMPIPHPPKGE